MKSRRISRPSLFLFVFAGWLVAAPGWVRAQAQHPLRVAPGAMPEKTVAEGARDVAESRLKALREGKIEVVDESVFILVRPSEQFRVCGVGD